MRNCTKEINFDDYVWETSGGRTFTVQVTALLSTENKNFTDSYANVSQKAVITDSNYLMAQMKQYYERHYSGAPQGLSFGGYSPPYRPYKSTERIPLLFGVQDDSGKDLTNTVSPYFTISVDSTGDNVADYNYSTKYYPDNVAYDEATGITFWAWNQYIYDDSGNFISDGNRVFFNVTVVDKRGTQGNSTTPFALTDRCLLYPSDIYNASGLTAPLNFWEGITGIGLFGWLANQAQSSGNTLGSVYGSVGLNGCNVTSPPVVYNTDDNAIALDIKNNYAPKSDESQALFCGQRYSNNQPIDQLGDDMECVLFLKDSEAGIDGVHVQIGNENSDFTITNQNKQYIDFTVPRSDVMFTDVSSLINYWNQTGEPIRPQTSLKFGLLPILLFRI